MRSIIGLLWPESVERRRRRFWWMMLLVCLFSVFGSLEFVVSIKNDLAAGNLWLGEDRRPVTPERMASWISGFTALAWVSIGALFGSAVVLWITRPRKERSSAA